MVIHPDLIDFIVVVSEDLQSDLKNLKFQEFHTKIFSSCFMFTSLNL